MLTSARVLAVIAPLIGLLACGGEVVSAENVLLPADARAETGQGKVYAVAERGQEPSEPEPDGDIIVLPEPEPEPEAEPESVPLTEEDFPLPVVFVHGFSGFSDIGPLEYFFGVLDAFAEQGIDAYAPNQPPYASVEVRATVLGQHIDQILAATDKKKVHLFCHSQGGLDCRYLVSALGYADRVFDIVTIATPHRGTPLADIAEVAPDGTVNAAGLMLGWLFGLTEGEPTSDAWDQDDTTEADWAPQMNDAVAAMTSEGTAAFNETVFDHPDVPVFSVAAVSALAGPGDLCDGKLLVWPGTVDVLDPLLTASALAISGLSLRKNDGIVPTDSMEWGTFLGCIPADHFDQVGQLADTLPNVVSGFDHHAFYDTLYAFVADREAAASQ